MKVICIKQDSVGVDGRFDKPKLVEGNIYTVTNTVLFQGDYYYSLEEISYLEFWTMLFIPLSEIDETELIKERENQFQKI